MSKKKAKMHKTLVEQILDKAGIDYEPLEFATKQKNDVAQLEVDHLGMDEHEIYKTLVLTGNKTGPVVGVIPIDNHLSYKKLSKVSGNKKVGMVPLKDLLKTTGYEHGANTPIGIHSKYNYPIFLDQQAENQQIVVSSGQIGRSVRVNANELNQFLGSEFSDLIE